MNRNFTTACLPKGMLPLFFIFWLGAMMFVIEVGVDWVFPRFWDQHEGAAIYLFDFGLLSLAGLSFVSAAAIHSRAPMARIGMITLGIGYDLWVAYGRGLAMHRCIALKMYSAWIVLF